jgi:hypothetical protein
MDKRKPITNPEEEEKKICFCYPPVELAELANSSEDTVKKKENPVWICTVQSETRR